MHTLLTLAAAMIPAGGSIQSPVTPDLLPRSQLIGFVPRGVTSFGAAIDNGWLYVLGGYFGEPHAYSTEGQSRAFLRVNLLDPRDVRLLADVDPVQGAQLVPWNGQLIRVGGMQARNTAGEPSDLHSLSDAALYRVESGEWVDLPPLPHGRSSHRVAVIEDTLHVLGGWTMRGTSKNSTWASTELVLNLSDTSTGWVERDVPFQCRAHAAAVNGNSLVVVGGLTPDRSITQDVWILDPKTGHWSKGPDFPDSGFGLSATSQGDVIAASGASGTVYSLARGATEWTPTGQLGHGRIFHEIVAEGQGSMIAVGGIVGMGVRGRVRSIERLTNEGATEPIERFVIPAPCEARNRFGIIAKSRSVYLFGGNNSLGQHDFEPENFTGEAWRLDLGSLEWTKLEPTPTPRQSIQGSVTPNGKTGLAVGGFGHNGDDAVTQSTSWSYDFEFGDWSEGPSLLGSRSQFGLARRGESLWMFGGLDYDPSRPKGEEFDHRTDVAMWDGTSTSFTDSGVTLPRPRRAFAGAALDGRYYLVGGMREGFALLDEVDVFDFESKAWSTVAAPARRRLGANLVPLDGKLYLAGGSSPIDGAKGLESNVCIECYDPKTASWSTILDDVQTEMKHARTFAVDDRLCIFTMHRAGQRRAELVFVDVQALTTLREQH